MMVGDVGVGKTHTVFKFVSGNFAPDSVSTLGIDCKMKTIAIDTTCSVKVQIWDPAGQERFNSITNAYYRGAMGIVFMYDVTSRKSFDSISYWIGEVQKNTSDRIALMLLGNKNDLTAEKTVSEDDGRKFADFHSMLFMEVSAKTGENIDHAFTVLAKQIVLNRPAVTSESSDNTDTVAVITASMEGKEDSGRNNCRC